MENKKQVDASSSSSLDHLFGPMDSNSSASTFTTGYFDSVFPPLVLERERKQCVGTGKVGNPDNAPVNGMNEISGANGKGASSVYQNETMEPSYFSSSIFYGGQENYSPRTRVSESPHNCISQKRACPCTRPGLKKGKTMMKMEAIQALLLEETGGRVLFITNTPRLPS